MAAAASATPAEPPPPPALRTQVSDSVVAAAATEVAVSSTPAPKVATIPLDALPAGWNVDRSLAAMSMPYLSAPVGDDERRGDGGEVARAPSNDPAATAAAAAAPAAASPSTAGSSTRAAGVGDPLRQLSPAEYARRRYDHTRLARCRELTPGEDTIPRMVAVFMPAAEERMLRQLTTKLEGSAGGEGGGDTLLDREDASGSFLLHGAAFWGFARVVERLLEEPRWRARVNAREDIGMRLSMRTNMTYMHDPVNYLRATPLELAQRQGYTRVAAMLRDAGAIDYGAVPPLDAELHGIVRDVTEDIQRIDDTEMERGLLTQIDPAALELLSVCGSGAFGAVYRARYHAFIGSRDPDVGGERAQHMRDTVLFAAKFCRIPSDAAKRRTLWLEVAAQATGFSDVQRRTTQMFNGLSFLGYAVSGEYLVTLSRLRAGTLRDLLSKKSGAAALKHATLLSISEQLAARLHGWHIRPIPLVHGDIKSDNCLVDSLGSADGEAEEKFKAEWGDYGLMRAAGSVSDATGAATTVAATTVFYRRTVAPETIMTGVYSKECDTFAFGLMLAEVFCGERVRVIFERRHAATGGASSAAGAGRGGGARGGSGESRGGRGGGASSAAEVGADDGEVAPGYVRIDRYDGPLADGYDRPEEAPAAMLDREVGGGGEDKLAALYVQFDAREDTPTVLEGYDVMDDAGATAPVAGSTAAEGAGPAATATGGTDASDADDATGGPPVDGYDVHEPDASGGRGRDAGSSDGRAGASSASSAPALASPKPAGSPWQPVLLHHRTRERVTLFAGASTDSADPESDTALLGSAGSRDGVLDVVSACLQLHASARPAMGVVTQVLRSCRAGNGFAGITGLVSLRDAVWEGEVERVDALIHSGAAFVPPQSSQVCIDCPLHAAAALLRLDLLQTLIASGCPVTAHPVNKYGALPIHSAADLGSRRGHDLGEGNRAKWVSTPDRSNDADVTLHQRDVIAALLAAGSPVDAVANHSSKSALLMCCQVASPEAVRTLLDAGAALRPAGCGTSALHCAARALSLSYAVSLADAEAVASAHEVVRSILSAPGCDRLINAADGSWADGGGGHGKRQTPLLLACEATWAHDAPHTAVTSVLRMLLAAGADATAVDAEGRGCVATLVTDRCYAEAVSAVVEAGADVSLALEGAGRDNALHVMAAGWRDELVDPMPAVPDGRDDEARDVGASALDNLRRTFAALAAAGASEAACIEATNEQGHTPLMVAAERRNWAVVELLLAAGARPDAADSSGNTALHLAVRPREWSWRQAAGGAACVRALVSGGAAGDAPNEDGFTPVDIAIELAERGGGEERHVRDALQACVAAAAGRRGVDPGSGGGDDAPGDLGTAAAAAV